MLELACNNVEQSMLPLLNHSFEEVNERLNEDQIILLVPSPRQNPVFVERIQGNNLSVLPFISLAELNHYLLLLCFLFRIPPKTYFYKVPN